MNVWILQHGNSRHYFYTEYHADQFARALSLNKTAYTIESRRLFIGGKLRNGAKYESMKAQGGAR